jgi:soluble lytic murein transglycosylase
MRGIWILTPLLVALGLALGVPARAQQPAEATALAPAAASAADDSVILDMHQAFRRGDKERLAALLPQAAGHVLEPWAAYWALKARLEDATEPEVQDFLSRWAGTYQEDRLRNDWLLLAGKRRDWAAFARELPRFRMGDDPEVRCYASAMQVLQGAPASAAMADQVRRDWLAERREGDGCLLAAGLLRQAGRITADDVWRRRAWPSRPAAAGWRARRWRSSRPTRPSPSRKSTTAPRATWPGAAPAPPRARARSWWCWPWCGWPRRTPTRPPACCRRAGPRRSRPRSATGCGPRWASRPCSSCRTTPGPTSPRSRACRTWATTC